MGVLKFKSVMKSYQTGALLSREMNLASVSDARKPSLAWFEGSYDGRPFALRIVGKEVGRGIEGRRNYEVVLRLALAVQTKNLPGFKARYDHKAKSVRIYDVQDESNKDELFNGRSGAAFWEFVHKGYSVGFHDGDLRYTRGARELVFGERKALDSPFLFGKTVLTESPVVLVHDHARPNRTAQEVQELLNEMIEVAKVIEEEY